MKKLSTILGFFRHNIVGTLCVAIILGILADDIGDIVIPRDPYIFGYSDLFHVALVVVWLYALGFLAGKEWANLKVTSNGKEV